MASNDVRPCRMCLNARVDPELTDENDFSFHLVGECGDGFRIGIQSGYGRSMQILFEQWINKEWHLIGFYEPMFCPNCGRPLIEYKKTRSEGHDPETVPKKEDALWES